MKSNLISKSETSQVLSQISSQWKIQLPKLKNIKFHHIDDKGIIITGVGLTAVKIGENIVPFLDDILMLKKFPSVMVDMGAVKFVCKGANIMRPGITKFSDFDIDDIVCVVEESHNKFLAVGKANMSSKQINDIDKGEAIKNLHYISDEFWENRKEIKY